MLNIVLIKVNTISREYDKRVQQSFFLRHKGLINVKLHNAGALGLGMSRNVSGISNSLLQRRCDGSFFCFLLFLFSAIKEPVKELRLSLISGEKYLNKNISTILRVWECCSVTKLTVRIAWIIGRSDPCRRLFQVQPPSLLDFQHLWPPSGKNFQNPISRGVGGGFFLEQPNLIFYYVVRWYPCCLAGCFVSEQASTDDTVAVYVEVNKVFTILIHHVCL